MRRSLLIGPLALLAIWSLTTYTGLVRPILLPTPTDVAAKMAGLFLSGAILPDAGRTLVRLCLGFGLGVVIGVPIGLAMGSSQRVYDSLEVLVDFFRSVPVTALFPLFLLLFGIGDGAKVVMAAWSSSLLIIINTMYGVRHGSHGRKLVLKVMKASPRQLFVEAVIPDALPEILVGFRTGVSLALVVVVVSEMFLGTRVGLGQMIYNASLLYDTPTMYSAIIYTGLLGYAINKLFVLLEKRTVHWVGK
jgi:ABC-type nitrate/sulfonate/bicarbonate transport system permease component